MFCRVGRAHYDEFTAFLLDKISKVFAPDRRHVACATVWAFIVTHAGPFICPAAAATFTSIEIEKPSHVDLSRFQSVIASSQELDKPTIAQELKLLANLRPDVLVARIQIAKMPFKGIDFFKGKVALAQRFDAFHHVEQPTPRLQRLIAEKECLLPFRKNQLLVANDAVLNDVDFSPFRDLAKEDIGPDPAGAPGRCLVRPCGCCRWPPAECRRVP